jgi:hypothetical protein
VGVDACATGAGGETIPAQPAMFVLHAWAWADAAVPDWITLPSCWARRSTLTVSELLVNAWFTVCRISLELEASA